MSILRDVFRRRFRALMTISGISVGVLALVVLGAYVEKSMRTVDNVGGILEGKVIVVDGRDPGVMGMGSDNPLAPESLEALRALPGVKAVVESIPLVLDENAPMTGVPALIMGTDPGNIEKADAEEAFGYMQGSGRMPEAAERSVAAVGSDLIKKLDAKPGGTIELRGREFKVVGLLKPTLVQANDQMVYISMEDAREIYLESMPEAFRSVIDPDEVTVQAIAVAEDGVDPDELAKRIERDVADVAATGPAELQAQVEQLVILFDLVIVAVGAIALLVGGLSVVNTMLVAVIERTYEVGVKRALGATGWRIAWDVLGESAVLTSLAGAVGLAGGTAIVAVLNAVTYEVSQNSSFVITPRLIVATFAFALVLGLLGGAYPARYASRLDPIDALAKE